MNDLIRRRDWSHDIVSAMNFNPDVTSVKYAGKFANIGGKANHHQHRCQDKKDEA